MKVTHRTYFHIGFLLLLVDLRGMTETPHLIQTFFDKPIPFKLLASLLRYQNIFSQNRKNCWSFIYLVEPTIRMVLVQLRLSLSCLFLSILQNLEKQDECSKINKNIFATHVTKDKARRDTVGINTLVMIVHRVGLIYMCI